MDKYVIYQTTNTNNNKTYIGFHRVDAEELVADYVQSGSIFPKPYFGSGLLIKDALKKYGEQSFSQQKLFETDNREEAITKEKELVTEEFAKNSNTYNIAIGGHGCASEISRMKRGEKVSLWITNNPEKHQERMNKINKNPDKIKKMAQKHLGMKRSEAARKNISESLKGKPSHSLGRTMAFNPNLPSPVTKYFDSVDQIPFGWVHGHANRGKTRGSVYTDGSVFRVFKNIQDVPDGWIKRGPKKPSGRKPIHAGKIIAYDPLDSEGKLHFFEKVEDIPTGWVRGRPKKKRDVDGN